MAVIFPVDPIDQQEFVVDNRTYVYNATKGYWRLAVISEFIPQAQLNLYKLTVMRQ
jgi:hypothetical protein